MAAANYNSCARNGGATPPLYIGTAGWNIPGAHRARFSADGSQLQRYSSRLNAAEINSSFWRPHRVSVYERWARSVPPSFRFSVKLPKVITHDRQLTRARVPLLAFLSEARGLGVKLGALLIQLPPSLAFDSRRAGRFLDLLRHEYDGPVACEPRHSSWTSRPASVLLERFAVARVAADPPRADGLAEPGGWPGLVYYRWHGSPRPYFSDYDATRLDDLAATIRTCATETETWCIFDNTGSGAAAGNALDLAQRVAPADDAAVRDPSS